MYHLTRSLFCKAPLIASLSLAMQTLFALPCQLNEFGTCDIPDSTLVQSNDGSTTTIHHEPLSQYGNPSFYSVNGKKYHVLPTAAHYDQIGVASWYGDQFHGKLTANREVFDKYQYTAASKNLPIPCFVKVTNLRNGKTLIVRVNDRGPYVDDRLIDLSYAAAEELGFADEGTTKVRVTVINSPLVPQANHYLQIASFSDIRNAEQLFTKLKNFTGESIRIHKTYNEDHPSLYRIEVGPFTSRDEVSLAQRIFKQKGYQHTIAILS